MSWSSTLDRFLQHAYGQVGPLDGPATRYKAITPSDSVDLPWIPRGIIVGTAGNVKLDAIESDTSSDASPTIAVAAGIPIPCRMKRIWATGTTAAQIVIFD